MLAPGITGIEFTGFSHQLDGPRWPCLSLLFLLSFPQPSVSDEDELQPCFPRITLIVVAQMITVKKTPRNNNPGWLEKAKYSYIKLKCM